MDVTLEQDIQTAVSGILNETGHIDGLIHFAGIGLRGFFEDLTLEEIRRVFDVNVFGIMALTQAVLPHMRKRCSGRIIITSSAAGRMGTMSISGYCSSKFAVEGFAECLSQEVRPFNIHVSLLEPGLIRTPHFSVNRNRAKHAVDPNSPYYRWFCRHEAIVDRIMDCNRFTAADIARLVHQMLTARRPKLRYMVGAKLKLIASLRRHIPGEIFERMYWGAVRRMVTNPTAEAPKLSE
jgi:NAD(P)-dependent dehydrogenase (short-subunit alcohol dehydrogenase family)